MPGFIKLSLLVSLMFTMSLTAIVKFSDYPNDSMNSIATSSVLSPSLLALFRATCLVTNLLVLAWLVIDQTGTLAVANGLDRRPVPIVMVGLLRLAPFTVWSWILQGLYFAGALYIQYCTIYDINITTKLSDALYILYEVCFAVSILVTVIVTFVLIPAGVRGRVPVDNFFTTAALIMHNANVYSMVLELIFNNVDKFYVSHLPFCIVYGLIYTVWGWTLAYSKGFCSLIAGFYFYFFMNHNFPRAVLAHLGVLVALSISYSVGIIATVYLSPRDNLFFGPVLLVCTYFICKFKHPLPLVERLKHE